MHCYTEQQGKHVTTSQSELVFCQLAFLAEASKNRLLFLLILSNKNMLRKLKIIVSSLPFLEFEIGCAFSRSEVPSPLRIRTVGSTFQRAIAPTSRSPVWSIETPRTASTSGPTLGPLGPVSRESMSDTRQTISQVCSLLQTL